MKKLSLSGNGAVAYAMKQINPDVVAAFPITPSTEIPESFSQYVTDGLVDTEFISVESEHSAMSACIGSSLAGGRTMTATSSNGLAYMWEMLHIASSMRTSVVLSLVTRAISAPLSIHNDHSDVMGMRDTGWIILFAEDNQEAYDNFIISTKLAEDKRVKLPVATCQDGFITSHSIENLEVLDDEKVKGFVGEFNPEYSLLKKENPVTFGALDLPAYSFEHKVGHMEALRKSKKILKELDKEYEQVSGRKYEVIEEYMAKDAEHLILAMGSTIGTIKTVVDKLREQGEKVGVLKIRLYRPFPGEELVEMLRSYPYLQNIGVMDKVGAFSDVGSPLYQDVLSALYSHNHILPALNYIYGIGGRDIKPEDINKVYDDLKVLDNNKCIKCNETKFRYLGLRGE